MTMRKAIPQRIPAEQLHEALFGLLTTSQSTADDLARITGYSTNAVRGRLNKMKISGLVLRESVELTTGRHYMWRVNSGTKPQPSPQDDAPAKAYGVSRVTQRIVSTYPAINRRDRLVAAFFGPSAPGMHSPTLDSAPAAGADVAPGSSAPLMCDRSDAC